MTSKLRCPFCGKKLTQSYFADQLCCEKCWENATERVWQAMIQSLKDRKELAIKLAQTTQSLEQSEKCCSAWETQALDYKAETIALSGKLEIARKTLKELWQATHYDTDGYLGKTIQHALEQTTYDNSEKANSQEHKE